MARTCCCCCCCNFRHMSLSGRTLLLLLLPLHGMPWLCAGCCVGMRT